MDDLIYFLLLIGWLAFSFYQQSVKKKKKLEKMKAEREQHISGEEHSQYEEIQTSAEQDIPAVANEKKPGFKSVLEEILLGEQVSLEQIPEQEAQSLETIPNTISNSELENRQKNIYQKYYDEQFIEKLDNTEIETVDQSEDEEQMVVLNDDEYTENSDIEAHRRFNLREAIIYSEILNRRYTN